MKSGCCFPHAAQCTATSKRTGKRCRAPAVREWQVCRFHGAGGGAPKGKRNGMYCHGLYTNEAEAQRKRIGELMKKARKMMADI